MEKMKPIKKKKCPNFYKENSQNKNITITLMKLKDHPRDSKNNKNKFKIQNH